MELKEALHTRRSIRKFTDRPVPRPLLESLLKEALWSPSGMNRQPWKFVVLQGKAFDDLVALSTGMAGTMEGPLQAQNFNEKMRAFITGFFKNLGGAGTAVVSLSKAAPTELADHANMVSAAAAFYNFLLLAHEAGLATCWMTGYLNVEADLFRLLGIEGYKLVGVTPVGYADQVPPVPPRKHEDIVWME